MKRTQAPENTLFCLVNDPTKLNPEKEWGKARRNKGNFTFVAH